MLRRLVERLRGSARPEVGLPDRSVGRTGVGAFGLQEAEDGHGLNAETQRAQRADAENGSNLQTGMAMALPEVAEAGGGLPEWVHVLPLGQWPERDWTITAETCREMERNCAAGLPAAKVVGNFNHDRRGRSSGSLATGKRAPVALQARGDGLWIKPNWSRSGSEALAARDYTGISGEWHWDFEDRHGKKHGPVFCGWALTNDPFFSTELPFLAEDGEGGGEPDRSVGRTGDEGLEAGAGATTDTEHTEGTENGGNSNGQAGVDGAAAGGISMTPEQIAAQAASTAGQGGASGGPGASGAQPGPVGTPGPAAAASPTAAENLAQAAARTAGAGNGGQAGLPAPYRATLEAAVASPEMAELRARMERVEAENASLRAVNERAEILEAVRQMTHPADKRRHMAPALAEMATDLLLITSNDPAKAINMAEAGKPAEMKTPRERLMTLLQAAAGEWPLLAEIGGGIRPVADVSGLSEAERSERLNELAQAKAATMAKAEGESENDWYARRVEAAIAEAPDLRRRG